LVHDSRLVQVPVLPVRAWAGFPAVAATKWEGGPDMGKMFLAASTTSKGGSNLLPFLIIAVLFGLFYVLMIRPQRNRQRAASQMQNTVTPGQRIRTTAGIYGTIVSADDRDVVVQVAPGVEIRMLRRAVMDVVPDDDSADGTQGMPESRPDDTPAGDWDTPERNI
jgi:preprotein translocase subunit YajC